MLNEEQKPKDKLQAIRDGDDAYLSSTANPQPSDGTQQLTMKFVEEQIRWARENGLTD